MQVGPLLSLPRHNMITTYMGNTDFHHSPTCLISRTSYCGFSVSERQTRFIVSSSRSSYISESPPLICLSHSLNSMSVAVGSSIQIALFVVPLLVVLAWIMDKPLTRELSRNPPNSDVSMTDPWLGMQPIQCYSTPSVSYHHQLNATIIPILCFEPIFLPCYTESITLFLSVLVVK